MPSVLVKEDFQTVSSVRMKVGELYAVDLPDLPSLNAELKNWHIKWESEERWF